MGEVNNPTTEPQAMWPLKEIRNNPQLIQHVFEELQALDVENVYHGGEKTTDENEKAARQEVERVLLEYVVQRVVITDKLKETNLDDLKRMENLHDLAVDYIENGRVRVLEDIYQASKKGPNELADLLNGVYQEVFREFRKEYGSKEIVYHGKSVDDVRSEELKRTEKDTREQLGKVPGGPKGPRGALANAESKTDQFRGEIQGGSPQ